MPERQVPRISINKLGEYLVATPSRRRAIIKEQKYPAAYRVSWYSQADHAISDWFLSPTHDKAILTNHINQIGQLVALKEQERQRNQNCVEAIIAFGKIADGLDLADVEVIECRHGASKLLIAGVEISVRPEFILRRSKDGQSEIGIEKIYFSKNNRLTEDSGAYVAALVRRYAEEYLMSQGQVNYRNCSVLDVFGERIFCSPRLMSRKLQDVESACQEIAARWDTI
ncbi:MAG TPA: hypothetical protein VH413_18705 [Verrucomicrobiae bacterium]|jgi:hypothetical protein|nr:hypothetical protein [Verrucomicrobiae bacterium]